LFLVQHSLGIGAEFASDKIKSITLMRVEHRYVKEGMYTPQGATSLLIGTFPSILIREKFNRVRPTDVDFFYGSIDNNFWTDLGIIYDRTFSFDRSEKAIEQRIDLLDAIKMAMSDAIFACETSGSAMDTALQNIELNDQIISVLDKNPSISKLYFTSSSGKVNAETLTLRLLKESKRLSQMKILQKNSPRKRTFLFIDINGSVRMIDTVTLISPSPLAEQWGGITPEKRQAVYKQHLPALPQS
jgi:G:T/U-mismatch repair DNA glycosylase